MILSGDPNEVEGIEEVTSATPTAAVAASEGDNSQLTDISAPSTPAGSVSGMSGELLLAELLIK